MNTAVFYALYVGVSSTWSLTSGGQSVWLIAAVAWWLLGLISAPWFRPPRDALAGAITSLTLLLSMTLPPTASGVVLGLRAVSVAYVIVVIALAVTAAMLGDRGSPSVAGELAFRLAGSLSAGAALFGAPALVSILGFYSGSEQGLIIAVWAAFAAFRPTELIISTFSLLRGPRVDEPRVGVVKRIDDPGLVRVELDPGAVWDSDVSYVVILPGGVNRYVMPVSVQMANEAVFGTGILVGDLSVMAKKHARVGTVLAPTDQPFRPDVLAALGGSQDAKLAGIIVEGSEISSVRVELLSGVELRQGSVLTCRVNNTTVLYQVFGGRTHEESFWQNPRGSHIVEAVQLGAVDDSSGKLVMHPWIPTMNSPVFVNDGSLTLPQPDGFHLGNLEAIGAPVTADVDLLVSHHTAILGMTGTGKTELTFEVIEAVLAAGIKVVCVDLTGEYADRVSFDLDTSIGLSDPEVVELEQKLLDVDTGTYGAPQEKRLLDEFLRGKRDVVALRVADFLESDEQRSALVELAEIANSRATLRATEMILSEIMLWCRSHPGEERVLIVLEEAHTIIPEKHSAGSDFETQGVVGRIGQIALQGRKYGVGLLIVSQRTALVSKSVLSQCNTVMAFSVVDQTSLGYLENVFGRDHVAAIPGLGFLEMVVGGKATNVERPVLVRRPFKQELA